MGRGTVLDLHGEYGNGFGSDCGFHFKEAILTTQLSGGSLDGIDQRARLDQAHGLLDFRR